MREALSPGGLWSAVTVNQRSLGIDAVMVGVIIQLAEAGCGERLIADAHSNRALTVTDNDRCIWSSLSRRSRPQPFLKLAKQ